MRNLYLAFLLLACGFLIGLTFRAGDARAELAAAVRADEPPDDQKLYVWPAPDKGTQSMLVLKAVDGEQVEAAFLVPVTVVLDYKGKPKATREQIDHAAGGRLLPFDLRGKDRFGRLQADVWLGKPDKDNVGGWITDSAPKVKTDKK